MNYMHNSWFMKYYPRPHKNHLWLMLLCDILLHLYCLLHHATLLLHIHTLVLSVALVHLAKSVAGATIHPIGAVGVIPGKPPSYHKPTTPIPVQDNLHLMAMVAMHYNLYGYPILAPPTISPLIYLHYR